MRKKPKSQILNTKHKLIIYTTNAVHLMIAKYDTLLNHWVLWIVYLKNVWVWCVFFGKFCPAIAEILLLTGAQQSMYGKHLSRESFSPDDIAKSLLKQSSLFIMLT